jgi:enoyl-CoA hydratase/carnithine racemase
MTEFRIHQHIQLQIHGHHAVMMIDRPAKRNALTQAMWQAVADACDTVAGDPAVRVLFVRGAGGVFAAGADIEEMTELVTDLPRMQKNNEIVRLAQMKLQALDCATVAVIEGACVGGGCGLALACDFRLAREDAQFAITPARLGLLYSVEDVRRVVNIIGPAHAKQLLLTGEKINAATALSWGMLSEICRADELDARIAHWQALLSSVSPVSVSGIKRTIAMVDGSSNADLASMRALFDAAFEQADFAEGTRAFLAKRAPRF